MVGVQSDASQEKQMGIEPVLSVGEGDMETPTEKHGHLHRTLSPRLIHVCSNEEHRGIFQLTNLSTDDFNGLKCRKWSFHRYWESPRKGRPWKHGYCIPFGLYWRVV